MNGTCLAVSMVAGERFFHPFEVVRGTRAEASVDEDLAEVGWFAEVNSGGCFKEIVCGGV